MQNPPGLEQSNRNACEIFQEMLSKINVGHVDCVDHPIGISFNKDGKIIKDDKDQANKMEQSIPSNARVDTISTFIDEHGFQWELVTVKLDSGASEWVFNPHTAEYFRICETLASVNGLNFTAANGTAITNYGMRTIKALDNDGQGYSQVQPSLWHAHYAVQ